MPNKNYRAGRAFEYALAKTLRVDGWTVMRTAGSHGAYDLIAIRENDKPFFIQCKVVSKDSERRRLQSKWWNATDANPYYTPVLAVKVKGDSGPSLLYRSI